MSVLGLLQSSIEALHAIETELDVRAYVVDEQTRRAIPGAREGLPEQLFVREQDGDVEIALYIDPELVAGLEADHPHRRLHAGNIESYCVALEGVSHFVFLTWRAQRGRPVTALELELQAEVDKFVTAWLLLAAQGQGLADTADTLLHNLFDSYALRAEVATEEAGRYQIANEAARRYCRGLVQRFAQRGGAPRIKADVRRFYRRGLADKVRAA